MERYDASHMYFVACKRISDAAEEMYEKLHNDDGEPLNEPGTVEAVIKHFQKNYRIEIDLIRQTVLELLHEQKKD